MKLTESSIFIYFNTDNITIILILILMALAMRHSCIEVERIFRHSNPGRLDGNCRKSLEEKIL